MSFDSCDKPVDPPEVLFAPPVPYMTGRIGPRRQDCHSLASCVISGLLELVRALFTVVTLLEMSAIAL
jgi:hypothetical protein